LEGFVEMSDYGFVSKRISTTSTFDNNNNNNNNNTLIYIAPACRMTSEALISTMQMTFLDKLESQTTERNIDRTIRE